MEQIQVSLFGKMAINYQHGAISTSASGKAQELFGYLLLHRNRTHSRERLASLMWGDYCTTSQSKKYLRKALWQLQSSLNEWPAWSQVGLIESENEWIRLNQTDTLQLDVAEFERAYEEVKGLSGSSLTEEHIRSIEKVIACYRGELLENWYFDWCQSERERFHEMYLRLVQKGMTHAEANGHWEKGIEYGSEMLRRDPAHEQTHCAMMRIYQRLGDRSSALRQFQRCEHILKDELGVHPAATTRQLYERIKSGTQEAENNHRLPARSEHRLDRLVKRFEQLKARLESIQEQVEETIKGVETELSASAEA